MHRCRTAAASAEGFGRGAGEAMYLGRLALATGWSGNLDYMNAENSLLVDYTLVPVGANEYPHGDGQSWAEPNVDHAFGLLNGVITDRASASEMAQRGRRDIRLGYSYRAVGLRILERIREIANTIDGASKPPKPQRERAVDNWPRSRVKSTWPGS